MKKEDKELLLKDLCGRLPYGTKCLCKWTKDAPNGTSGCIQDLSTFIIEEIEIMDNPQYECQICDVKPYLRPMSSMTEEERKDLLVTIVGNEGVKYFQVLSDGSIDNTDAVHQDLHNFNMHWIIFDKDTVTLYLDWLNAHHFDYRGLIERGLALEAPEGMYVFNF